MTDYSDLPLPEEGAVARNTAQKANQYIRSMPTDPFAKAEFNRSEDKKAEAVREAERVIRDSFANSDIDVANGGDHEALKTLPNKPPKDTSEIEKKVFGTSSLEDQETQIAQNTAESANEFVKSLFLEKGSPNFTEAHLRQARQQYLEEEEQTLRIELSEKSSWSAKRAIEEVPLDIIPDVALLDTFLQTSLEETAIQVRLAINALNQSDIREPVATEEIAELDKRIYDLKATSYQTAVANYHRIEKAVQGSYQNEKRQFCLDEAEAYKQSAEASITSEELESARRFGIQSAKGLYFNKHIDELKQMTREERDNFIPPGYVPPSEDVYREQALQYRQLQSQKATVWTNMASACLRMPHK